ncbi:DUF1287 domain-containing protein [Arenimonas terrae]|jgi:uncharacterized protein YijF (DUF1287 family)|uniref:DUF1287 domain-containing protein n=1 Tax=Arenimonas terrae TaxID=2546226 RepID=A0A5C4RVM3_9GAMM|nr:DUF1287 domain-containing protein [Arenimonas terrae]TNJ34962.1 DUF1287 domain-containing protein [Arenimonas terrae]
MAWRRALAALVLLAASVAGAAAAQDEGVARVLAAAHAQVGVTRYYDGSYVRLAYPGGDVPADRGVCTDVVIRAYRAAGLDLQKAVHEDMRTHFAAYPKLWGLARPDRNIDHRRVPNLETWARRAGHALPAGTDPASYRPGDLVSWRLPNGLPHIGLVSDRRAPDGSGRPLVVHNIGAGTQVEDVLFAWPPVGHFRVFRDPAPAGSR